MRHYAGSAIMLVVTTAVIVGSYTVNLKVSAERAEVDRLHRALVVETRNVRDMQAELRTRARPPLIQRWNDDVLMMATPAASQYLRNPVALVSFAASATPGPTLRNAVTPAAPTVAQLPSVVRTAYRASPPTVPGVVDVAYRPPAALGAHPVAAPRVDIAVEAAPQDPQPDTEPQP